MLTGGGVAYGDTAWEWVGNDRGCGILNSMCQFGQDAYNGILYDVASCGS